MARSQSTTLSDAVVSFDRSRWDLRPTTKVGYLKTFKRFGSWFESEHKRIATLADLSDDCVNGFLASNANHRTMARNDCVALRQLAHWATKAHIFLADPLASVELPKASSKRRKPFADAEVKTIIAAAAESQIGQRDRAIVVLGLATALRPAEIWQLQLSDVDLRGGWVTVRLETTKTSAGERTIPLDPQAIAALDEYINDYRGTHDGPLFLNARGDPFKRYGFMAIFARLKKRLSSEGIHFQAYRSRHTGITNWSRAGLNAPTIQQLAGHRSIVTTQRYIGQLGREDLARLPAAFTRVYGRVG